MCEHVNTQKFTFVFTLNVRSNFNGTHFKTFFVFYVYELSALHSRTSEGPGKICAPKKAMMTSQLLECAGVTWLVITCHSGQWKDLLRKKKKRWGGSQISDPFTGQREEKTYERLSVKERGGGGSPEREAHNEACETDTAVRADRGRRNTHTLVPQLLMLLAGVRRCAPFLGSNTVHLPLSKVNCRGRGATQYRRTDD